MHQRISSQGAKANPVHSDIQINQSKQTILRITRRVLQFVAEGERMTERLNGVHDGGVNDALNLDAHGKALSFVLLDMPVRIPSELVHLLVGHVTPDRFHLVNESAKG